MAAPVSLQALGARRLKRPADMRWLGDVPFVPVALTELHLAARAFALAVDPQARRLGLLLDPADLRQPLLHDGGWRGGYQPLALRCHPFVLVAPEATDPLEAVGIAPDSAWLSDDEGVPFVADGAPTALSRDLARMLGLLAEAEAAFQPVIDRLLIGGLLKPLTDGPSELMVVDPAAIRRLTSLAWSALARDSFLAADVLVAGGYSLQALRPERRPRPARPEPAPRLDEASTLAFDDLALALDDGELIAIPELPVIQAPALA
jgi:hypothetical protein